MNNLNTMIPRGVRYVYGCLPVLLLMISLIGCANEPDFEFISARDVEGAYLGNARIKTNNINQSQVDISLMLQSDTIYFENFPVGELMEHVLSDEILKSYNILDTSNYKMGYKASLSDGYTHVLLTFSPKPLLLNIDDEPIINNHIPSITIDIVTRYKGVFSYNNNNLQFVLHAEKILINDEELLGTNILYFSFTFSKP